MGGFATIFFIILQGIFIMINFFDDLEGLRIWLEKGQPHQSAPRWPIKVVKQNDDGRISSYSLQIGNSHETHSFKPLSAEKERQLGKDPELFVVYDITNYADRGVANAGLQRHKEEEIKRQIDLLREIMRIDQKH